VNIKHIVIEKMFEKKVKYLLKRRKERQPTKKRLCLVDQFLFFLGQRLFQRRGCATKRFFRRLGTFDYQ
jgi:hypothetical protein